MGKEKIQMNHLPICDTHAHYDEEAFDPDRDSLLETDLRQAGVEFAVNMGASMRGAEASARLSEKYEIVYAGCGIHPDDVGVFEHAGSRVQPDSGGKDDRSDVYKDSLKIPEEEQRKEQTDRLKEQERFATPEDAMRHLEELCRRPKTVCVGEIGLDYHWMVEEKEVQKKWFREQMLLAYKLDLPINVHSRNAAQDTFDLIKENYDSGRFTGGIIHCFSGSRELAREYVKLGYYLGIGGVVTFKNSKTLKKVVEEIPLENLVTETDSPYMSPEPFRGKRNDSRNIIYVIEKIAEIKQMDAAECAAILGKNAHDVYRIKDIGS